MRNVQAARQRSWFDASLLLPLFEAAHARRQARILSARAADGELVSAVLYVWNHCRLWYFLPTRDPARAANGAVSLLLWFGAACCSLPSGDSSSIFDGIASEGVARFHASFGARPRLAGWRRNVPYALFTSALDALRGRSNRNASVAP